ncbi:MAG: dihydroneopterin aldolase [Chitinophagaceae bacterium]
MRTVKICVNEFKIHAFHGIHPIEKKIGCIFSVDLSVKFNKQAPISHIDDSIDYEILVGIIRNQMNVTRDLLESVCQDILDEIFNRFNYVKEMDIHIKKLDPLIENFKGSLSVNMIQIH